MTRIRSACTAQSRNNNELIKYLRRVRHTFPYRKYRIMIVSYQLDCIELTYLQIKKKIRFQ